MLKLENIKKEYPMKDSSVLALKGLSINFRKNEFVSILGPSGCGKTTLLNILGGLDKYTAGDLIIDGRSTKNFNDHDWDIYRNHRIGFIFQAYNLIPHENILENVELSLTISGVSKKKRTKKAMTALDKVGLKGMYKKMPNQLSGGQCQRVAIARALVNEPEILLADEPTGALDSVTSVQIMELIKEISKEKLVIMVTHNPDLAYQYSTRIVKLLDGELIDDSNPYSAEDEENERKEPTLTDLVNIDPKEYSECTCFANKIIKNSVYVKDEEEEDKKKKKASEKTKMSWWTAFKLSTKNLWAKRKRTILTTIAASIGIIGVSAVLAVSSGVTGYIDGMQDEMLSGNPVQVAQTSFDLSSITSQMTTTQQSDVVKDAAKDGYINVDFMTERLINSAKDMGSSMIENDITQEYVDYVDNMPKEYYKDVVKKYGINVNYNIYTDDDIVGYDDNTFFSLNGITSIATSILEEKLATNGYASYASVVKSYSTTFAQSLNNEEYLLSQYDVVEGKVAKEADEIMIVLSSDEEVTDFTLALLGYYSQKEFFNVIDKYNVDENGNSTYDEALYNKSKEVAINALMDKEFYYYPNDTIYTKNESYNENAQTPEMMLNPDVARPFFYNYKKDSSWTNGTKLKVVGIVKPKEGRQYSSLDSGFYYTPAFSEKYINDNINSELSTFINNYVSKANENNTTGTSITGYTTTSITNNGQTMKSGIYYDYKYTADDTEKTATALLGSSSSMNSILSALMGSTGSTGLSTSTATLTPRQVGGSNLPSTINFYPNSFDDKYLVTNYLDQWNKDVTLTINGKTVKYEDRVEIKYTDNLEVVISMINNVINIVTIALIAFTALSLVVSTVMIAIITYVSVIERIKEIGVIRALGGRKKDVSHLFNAETFIIGLSSGVFGIAITYLLQLILNLVIHSLFPAITAIASLPWTTALIVIGISILLTVIAGFIPSRSAAKKDPVVALRSE